MKYEQSVTANISDQEKTFRSLISNDPVLSYFLETGVLDRNARFLKEPVYRDHAFVAFVSPYFRDVYVKAILNAFDSKDANLMSDVVMNPILLDFEHRQQAFDQILVYLEGKKAQLLSIHHKLVMYEPVNFIDLPDFTNIMTISNLNYLSVEFLEFRTAYAEAAIKVLNAVVNRELQIALNMVINLRELVVDTQTSDKINELYKLFSSAHNDERARECDKAHWFHRRHRHFWEF